MLGSGSRRSQLRIIEAAAARLPAGAATQVEGVPAVTEVHENAGGEDEDGGEERDECEEVHAPGSSQSYTKARRVEK